MNNILQIKITQAHADRAKAAREKKNTYRAPSCCVLAEGFKEYFNTENISVGATIVFADNICYRLGDAGVEMIANFDVNGEVTLPLPYTVTLEEILYARLSY
jgi:hypothetical protein